MNTHTWPIIYYIWHLDYICLEWIIYTQYVPRPYVILITYIYFAALCSMAAEHDYRLIISFAYLALPRITSKSVGESTYGFWQLDQVCQVPRFHERVLSPPSRPLRIRTDPCIVLWPIMHESTCATRFSPTLSIVLTICNYACRICFFIITCTFYQTEQKQNKRDSRGQPKSSTTLSIVRLPWCSQVNILRRQLFGVQVLYGTRQVTHLPCWVSFDT